MQKKVKAQLEKGQGPISAHLIYHACLFLIKEKYPTAAAAAT
jgi:hypothetical protein